MIVWRLCKAKYASTALDGIGAAKTGNRWNERNVRMVYTSATLALAALELLVHVDPVDAPSDLVAVSAEIPHGVTIRILRKLPANWNATPAVDSTAKLGSRWVARGGSAVLKVPSVVVPAEFNYLLNPEHPDFARILIRSREAFTFDPRLLEG